MTNPRLAAAARLGRAVVGPPYDLAAAQALCDVLERMLAAHLRDEPTWVHHEWLDGFVPAALERDRDRLTIRGAVWVNAVRAEPCEVELELQEPLRATFRFMGEPSRRTVSGERAWRFIFALEDRESAG